MPIDEDESTSCITKLQENDVLFGRGACSDRFEGNIRFRKAIRDRSEEYRAVNKSEDKTRIAMHIVHLVEAQNGRFLRRIQLPTAPPKNFHVESNEPVAWMPVEATIVLDKIKQALRDATGKECKRRQSLEHVNLDVVEPLMYSTSSEVVDFQANMRHDLHDQKRKHPRGQKGNEVRPNDEEMGCLERTTPATTEEVEIRSRQSQNVVQIQPEQCSPRQNPTEQYHQENAHANCGNNFHVTLFQPAAQTPPTLPEAHDPASLLQSLLRQCENRRDVPLLASHNVELVESPILSSNRTVLVESKGEYRGGHSHAIDTSSTTAGMLLGHALPLNPATVHHFPLLVAQRQHETKGNEGISSIESSAHPPFQREELSQRQHEHNQGNCDVMQGSDRSAFSMGRSDQTTLLRADDTDECQNRDEVQNKEGHGQLCIRAIRAAQTFQTFQLNESTRSLVASSWQIIPETYLGILLTLNTPFTIDDLQILALTWTWAVSFHASSCLEQIRIVIESLLQMESSRLRIGRHVVQGIHNALYGEITPLSDDEQLFIRVTL